MSRPYLSKAIRKIVYERAQGCCEYCLSQAIFATQPFSIEHILPFSKGGSNTPENLALACQGCNGHKYNKTTGLDPVTQKEVSLFHPRQDHWQDHFSWDEQYVEVIGLSASGRASVVVMQLNREGLKNLRKVLFQLGEHPPG